ncbi:hypothetical protein A3737_35270 [Oleiphilus sp. HI0065]|nr:hypothetical protein A3737_35270 [Oleiphilus sp. HI0065]
MEALWAAGAKVKAYDPEASEECTRIYGERDDLALLGSKEAAIEGAEALVICTEWKNFRAIDYEAVKQKLVNPVIVDGRNLYDPAIVKSYGFTYYAIGRK